MLGTSALKQTFLAALMSACALPAYLLKACDVLDNPWAMTRARACKVRCRGGVGVGVGWAMTRARACKVRGQG